MKAIIPLAVLALALVSPAQAQTGPGIMLGVANSTGGPHSTAVGQGNNANVGPGAGSYSQTFGRYNSANPESGLAVGSFNTIANGNNSIAYGYGNYVTGQEFNLAFGSDNRISAGTSGIDDVTVGLENYASNSHAVAVGVSNSASGDRASSVGSEDSASASYASSLGSQNSASAQSASAVGKGNSASGLYSSAFGFRTSAGAELASAFGSYVSNTVANSVAIGASNTAKLLLIASTSGSPIVGIGTTPATTDAYALEVNGSVHARDLVIDDSGWPDYVFDKGYKLAPLGEVERQIHESGHLPGIPSARQIAEGGLGVGQMQERLMGKVEELTLYVIAIQKQNEALQSRDAALQAQNASLAARVSALERR